MRRALALAWLLGLAAPAANAAVIEGRVRHATRGEPGANLAVEVIGFDAEQRAIERTAQSDAEGRFRFADLPAPAIYLVRPQGEGFTYPGTPVAFRPGESDTAPALELLLYDTSSDPDGLRLAQLQWVIERDAGVYRISQRARVANTRQTIVLVPETAPPLLQFALAPGHGDVATPFDRLPAGVHVRNGLAEIRGPIFPGDEGLVVQLSYDVAAAPGGSLETEIGLPAAVDALDLYVQDFGVVIDAGRLHPARVARQDDVFFQSFVGFDLSAPQAIGLRVRPLPPAPASEGWRVALAVALLTGALVWYVGTPVARRPGGTPMEPGTPEVAEGESLSAALADLEHDFETGKLSAEDRLRLEHELRHSSAPPAPAASRTPAPCACGHRPAPGDRFCAACGSAV